MSGAWSCLVRFACHIPCGMVAFGGGGLYNAVKVLDSTGIYDVIPNGRAFLYGLRMYSTWGIFGFVWNFVMFIGCRGCTGPLLVILGLVDAMIAVTLAVSVGKQAQFLPTTYGACDVATAWRNGTDGRNFFLTANSTTFSDFGGPDDLCYNMVLTWAVTVSVVILYGFTGIINLSMSLQVQFFAHEARQSHRNRHSNYSVSPTSIANWTDGLGRFRGFMLWLLKPALWILDHPLAVCRFGFRYICKALQMRNRPKDGKGTKHNETSSAGEHEENNGDSGGTQRLPLEVLLQIPQQLHFVDLVAANHPSNKLRKDIFGSEVEVSERLESLREIACTRNTKSSCEICGTQTCADCEVKRAVVPSPASKHLAKCQPYCSRCFFKTYCRWWAPQGQRPAKHRDTCPLSDRQTDVEMAGGTSVGAQTKTLCQMCASMTPAERRETLDARDQLELDRLARHPLACAKCKEMLPARGPRWWICHQCYTECPSPVHPPWAAS